MRPQAEAIGDSSRLVGEVLDLTIEEGTFLTLFRELSEVDRSYLVQAAEAMLLVRKISASRKISKLAPCNESQDDEQSKIRMQAHSHFDHAV